MKKFTLSLLFAVLCTSGLFAQRTADVEVLAILSPDTIFAGKPILIHYGVINNGPDSLLIGDSIYYSVGMGNLVFPAPGKIAFLRTMTKNAAMGDTLNLYVSFPTLTGDGDFDLKLKVITEIFNRANGLAQEKTPTADNNSLTADVHFRGFQAGVKGISEYKLSTSAYPNPTKNDVNISFVAAGGADFTINIMDINGKLVQSTNGTSTNGTNNVNMNVSELPAGVYMYQLKMENTTTSNKLVITK